MDSKNILVKVVIFSIIDANLKIFFAGSELPQNYLSIRESLDEAAVRIFEDTTRKSPKDSYFEQLYTVTQEIRKFKQVAVVYFVLYPEYRMEGSLKHFFWDTGKVDRKNRDFSIVSYAVQRLRWKIEYTNVVYSLLPEEFTLSELQAVYEAILGKPLDKRNFRKKILSLGLLKRSGRQKTGVKARPAQMYEFKSRKPVMVKVF